MSQSDADQRQDKASRTAYSEENPLWTLPLSLQTEPKPDLSLVEHQLPSKPLDQNQTPINGNHNIGMNPVLNKKTGGEGHQQLFVSVYL